MGWENRRGLLSGMKLAFGDLFPVLQGGNAVHFPEAPDKMTLIREAAAIGNIGNAEPAIHQQAAVLLHLQRAYIFPEAAMEIFWKFLGKVDRMQAGLPGEPGEGDLFVITVVQYLTDLSDPG